MEQATFQKYLKQQAGNIHPVVPFNPEKSKLLRLNFTAANKEISEDMLLNTTEFSNYISSLLQAHHCTYGIGGYNEHRTIYSRSPVFGADGSSQEPRRLHLGIDIWGKGGTPVYAPLDGTVHSFAFNDRFGDYGATIILQHLINGESFYILFGHLSLTDVTSLTAGQTIRSGDIVGHFGEPAENGGWPPHLHMQVIMDMQGYEGDYPGVCRYSERDYYLQNCPDPDFILRMMQYAMSF